MRLVYREVDSPSKSRTRTNRCGSGGRCHHRFSAISIQLNVISNPAIAVNVLLAVGLPSCLFSCALCIPPNFSPLAANFPRSTISINVNTRNAISNNRVSPTTCSDNFTFFHGNFTRFVNALELCALAVPDGFTATGLPLSLQIVCRAYDEETALRIGWAYQQASDWHKRHPPGVAG